MSLARYRAKRDFKITPEPPPEPVARRSGKTLSYFIQRHHARALHYDFRLEVNGVLKSWAVPKGPSLDPHDKRLAVHVEDHPYDYGSFEGRIPAHQYGAGEVVLWDRGEWLPIGDPVAGLKKGHLEFELRGAKLSGRWNLVRMGKPADKDKDKDGKTRENWLLIKEKDDAAREGKQADITALRPESVAGTATKKTGIAPGNAAEKPVETTSKKRKPAGRAATSMPMPDKVDAQLAMLVKEAPDGDAWLSEMKFDGYRGLCRIEGGKARIFTREHLDWSKRWPQLTQALAALDVEEAWIDGEVVAVLDDGSISFEALQDPTGYDGVTLAIYVFDLLWLNGKDLRDTPLLERKRLLREVVSGVDHSGLIRFSEHVVGDAAEVYRHACLHGMEGTVVKRADAAYAGRRDRSWVKLKCAMRQEFVIAGYTDPAGSRVGFGALLVGVYDAASGELHYAGRVGTGFDDRKLTQLLKRFKTLERDQPAFVDPPRGRLAHGVHWLAPKLVAEVKFAQWTRSGILRHGAFVALREDKKAEEIVREKAIATSRPEVKANAKGDAKHAPKSRAAKKPSANSSTNSSIESIESIEGMRLTHPDKLLFTDPDLSKRDLAEYYATVADWLLPHVQQRPMTMVRCPDGSVGKCFFQRHLGQGAPAAVEKIAVPEGKGSAEYMMVNDIAGLVATVQMGVLELHTWGAREGKLAQPDRIIFDLDPAPEVPWSKVVEGARLVHGLLEEIGLRSFVKTTGGKGLHVVVPIVPEQEWEVVKEWSRGVAEHMVQVLPDHFTAKMAKAARTGKIFIDYLRNAATATAVAAYSPRARSGAPVSVPLAWDELDGTTRADSFTVVTVPKRLASLKRDPWHDYAATRQRLTKKILSSFSMEKESA
ncbi:DNA ligase D [Herbaspirillum lusitanum]|uniref:DNA ligase D n=1 Tax=Herbaspirillum lusitanum TaxID=213312 RepID=UPI002238E9E5|nr:DNA ligase D [Herbaspirillum lusitanum]MCW5298815.1 DNA ligase D [Herbaspirillum lusitanum]